MSITLLAETGDGVSKFGALGVFGAAMLVGGIALLLTSRRFAGIRRRPVFAALISGGWLAIFTGFILGPHALDVVRGNTLLEVRPLMLIGLGWIGLIIGLEAHRDVLRLVPKSLWRWVVFDSATSLVIITTATVLILIWLLPESSVESRWIYLPAITLGVCAMGWSPETRSIRIASSPQARQIGLFIQAGAGLTAVYAVLVFGVLSTVAARDPSGDPMLQPARAVILILVTALVGLIAGFGGRWLLRQAGRDRPALLVVLLGMIAMIAGAAAELGVSPLLGAMLAGVVLANTSRTRLVNFEHLTHKAEHPMAMLFYLLAGILLNPNVGGWGVVLIGVLIAFRLGVKPIIMRRLFPQWKQRAARSAALHRAPIRQAPLAIAIAVALVIDEPSAFHRQLLAVIAISGLICDLVTLMPSVFRCTASSNGEVPAGTEVAPS